MKYCPYCGEGLREPEALFCQECGKKFLAERPPIEFPETESEKTQISGEEPAKKRWFRAAKEKAEAVPQEMPDSEPPEEIGYDGYYDDVLPTDLDAWQDGVDQGLIQKIILLAVGVILVIAACVAIMCFL